ncbi:MAG: EamA family transporter [Actinomycetaceae bacterium]|nr:EamA family transporter [Actinomycetaceae bacterium]
MGHDLYRDDRANLSGTLFFTSLMRALPAGLIALRIGRGLPQGSWWWKSYILGSLNTGAVLPFLFIATSYLPGQVAVTLGSVQPTIAVLLAVGVLKERLSHRWIPGEYAE